MCSSDLLKIQFIITLLQELRAIGTRLQRRYPHLTDEIHEDLDTAQSKVIRHAHLHHSNLTSLFQDVTFASLNTQIN